MSNLLKRLKNIDLERIAKNSWQKILVTADVISEFFDSFKKMIQSFLVYSKELFVSFPIRRKLSIIIGGVVFIVILVLSLIFQQTERRLLRAKLEEICNLTLQYLSSYEIKDNLLMGEYDEIKLSVLYIKQKNITGVDYAWVANREAELVAHTNIKLTEGNQEFFSDKEKAFLLNLKETTAIETETHFNYYYPIFETKRSGEDEDKVMLGVAGIGFSKEIALAPIKEAQNIIYTIALLVTIASVLGIYFLSHRMVKQIQELSAGARQIGQGNLDIKISIKSNDELGQLAQEFNNMTMHLKEKLHMQKFVSPITRKMIKRYLVSNDESVSVSQHRQIALLFSDVRDFSGFSQKHEPEVVVEVINIYLDLQARIIETHFGAVDKFMGDQVMAVFEGTNSHINLQNAAVTIQRAIDVLNKNRLKQNKEILTVGIGINIGDAVIGNIGSKDRMDYTVVGDAVNLASRFCDVAKPGQIITSTKLFSHIKTAYAATNLGTIKIKGRDELIEICGINY